MCHLPLRIISIVILLIGTTLLCGQDEEHQAKIDSVLDDLKTDLKPRARIAKQLKLVSYYKYSYPEVDSLIETSLSMAKESNFPFYIGRSYRFRARNKLYKNASPEDIIEDINEIEKLSQVSKIKQLPVWAAQLYADYYIMMGELEQAKPYIDSLAVYIDDDIVNGAGALHTVKGMFFQANREYEKAIEEYNVALTKQFAGYTLSLIHI